MNSIELASPAKINLFLEVLGKREDKYHEIISWMHTVDICDTVTLKASAQEYSTLQSDDTTIPFGKRNLCIKAFEALRNETGLSKNVIIGLEKEIPLGSGMGGGSSNAAAVIKGINTLMNLGLSNEKLMKIGAEVGSDVPFFISHGSALATGRGTEIEPLPKPPSPIWLVVAKPEISVSSGDAYQWMKDYRGERRINIKELSVKIESADLDYIKGAMHNAFEKVVIEKHPAIGAAKKALEEAGCMKAMMTGSGSAVFGLCENEKTACAAAAQLMSEETLSFVKACGTV